MQYHLNGFVPGDPDIALQDPRALLAKMASPHTWIIAGCVPRGSVFGRAIGTLSQYFDHDC